MRPLTCLSIYITLIILSSCSPSMYSNTGHNAPLFHQKGEVNIAGGYNETVNTETGLYAEGFDLKFATSVSDHTVIHSSFTHQWNSSETSDNWSAKGSYFEVGGGRYGVTGAENIAAGEIIGGIGFMSLKNTKGNDYIDAVIIKPYVQPTIGITHKIIDVAFTPRIAYISYLNNDYSIMDVEERSEIRRFFDDKKSTLVIEPGVTLRLGYKNFKLIGQWSYSTFKYESIFDDEFKPYLNRYLSIGLSILITDRYNSIN